MNNEIKESIANTIKNLDKELREISLKVCMFCYHVIFSSDMKNFKKKKIHDDPELGNKEFHAYKLLTEYIKSKGFEVTHKIAGLETAFMAKYSNNKSGRRVGFVCEYDSLPG